MDNRDTQDKNNHPLPIFGDPNYIRIQILRSEIIATIGNLKAAEIRCCQEITKNPIARRAAQLCTLELEGLEFHHPDLVNPAQHDHPVQDVVAKWFSPVFNCSFSSFHLAVWHIATTRYISQHVANVADTGTGGQQP